MHIVIMAGGAGIRFWPVSRKKKPKQFLNINGPQPMLVETLERIKPLAQDQEIIIVLGREHLSEAEPLLTGRHFHVLAEPRGRNTAPCMGLAAIYAAHLKWQTPMAFLPADHFIANPAVFRASLQKAAEVAASGAIATLGIVPTRPETGYGYIRKTNEHWTGSDPSAFRVAAFVEKPPMAKAEEYLRHGDYYWNAGIFVALPETILKALTHALPDLARALIHLSGSFGSPGFEQVLTEVYQGLTSVSFDYGVMEQTDLPVVVVPSACGWSDVGSWTSLYALKEAEYDEHQNLVEGQAVMTDCKQTFISNRSGRTIACLGLRNCLIVDTPETLLVADLSRGQEIRKVIEQLEKSGKEEKL